MQKAGPFDFHWRRHLSGCVRPHNEHLEDVGTSGGCEGCEGLVWLIGSNCPLARAVDGHIMRCGTIGSCQSAATSEIVKCCWSQV